MLDPAIANVTVVTVRTLGFLGRGVLVGRFTFIPVALSLLTIGSFSDVGVGRGWLSFRWRRLSHSWFLGNV